MRTINKKLLTISGSLVAILVALFLLFSTNAHIGIVKGNVQSLPEKSVQQPNTFSYAGEQGKNALTLLQTHASVSFAQPGMVNSINGRKAVDSKHEYWAFYVNGKMAQVGAAEYQTKNTDQIMWKIETY